MYSRLTDGGRSRAWFFFFCFFFRFLCSGSELGEACEVLGGVAEGERESGEYEIGTFDFSSFEDLCVCVYVDDKKKLNKNRAENALSNNST